MTDHPGMGVMLGMLGGNEDTRAAHKAAMGKILSSAELKDDVLVLSFTDATAIKIYDNGQSCCENRYMVTDDDLTKFAGATFITAELKEAPGVADEDGDHEVQFLEIQTSLGAFTLSTHNEHNGYYGGFWIVIRNVEEA